MPTIECAGKVSGPYDLVVGAMGINTDGLNLFKDINFNYTPPKTAHAYITEIHLGRETVRETIGDAMHVFLQSIPSIEFSAIVPKRDYATMVLLGEIGAREIKRFLFSREARLLFPRELGLPERVCHCRPLINIGATSRPFGDRIALVGDCGITRLYKDGIGAAYRMAKALATTAVFEGISEGDFRRHFLPACRRMSRDNRLGKLCFLAVYLIRTFGFLRKGAMSMAGREQDLPGERRWMSTAMWDTFTGSAPYRDILMMTLRPRFLFALLRASIRAAFWGT